MWFDVEIGYYTTEGAAHISKNVLWFDVEIGYYTTFIQKKAETLGCDLM